MRETQISTSEKTFINKCINEGQRLDGRGLDDFRDIEIQFGATWGTVFMSLGKTKVLANVTCEITEPKATRQNEGLLHINLELGPMAAPHFESGRQCELGIQVNRILERALKDSRCVDLESLCIVAEEKVWNLRVDLIVLNHEGNIIDCASVAALTALAHFKRPDVTISGYEVTIHKESEKDAIPIVLHHYPVCVSYSIFNNGKTPVADPTSIEEEIGEASMVFGINSYREICGLNLGGICLTSPEVLVKLASKAANRAKILVDKLKEAISKDTELRSSGKLVSFTESIKQDKITSMSREKLAIQLKKFKLSNLGKKDSEMEIDEDESSKFKSLGKDSGILLTKIKTDNNEDKWMLVENSDGDDDDDDEGDDDDDMEDDNVEELASDRRKEVRPVKREEDMSSGSEEESTVTLTK